MYIRFFSLIILSIFISCGKKTEKIKPSVESITESIYASGIVKSKNQYQAYATVNGIIEKLFVAEGDTVKKGSPILSISSEGQRLNIENAELAAQFSDFNANQGKLNDVKLAIEFAKNKMLSDSALYFRQKTLWSQQVGSKIELEQRELAYQNSKTAYFSSKIKYDDLKRQLDFTSKQAKKNLMISNKLENDYTVKSELEGVVYKLDKEVGEMVGAQSPLAIIGDAKHFILEMQVDEYDIIKIKREQKVIITMDSYRGQVFEAAISKINPIMNERTKTFVVEAEFTKKPETLYPNVTFEANIVIQSKDKTLLIPRNCLLNDSTVIYSNGENRQIKTGLKDYKMIEVLSGLTAEDEIIKPKD